jgi:hypothetical protein
MPVFCQGQKIFELFDKSFKVLSCSDLREINKIPSGKARSVAIIFVIVT